MIMTHMSMLVEVKRGREGEWETGREKERQRFRKGEGETQRRRDRERRGGRGGRTCRRRELEWYPAAAHPVFPKQGFWKQGVVEIAEICLGLMQKLVFWDR